MNANMVRMAKVRNGYLRQWSEEFGPVQYAVGPRRVALHYTLSYKLPYLKP